MNAPRVAIAHDYLTQRGGAERLVLSILKAFPDAPLYTTLYAPELTYPEFRDAHIITSPLNRVPMFRHDHRRALPLLPWASDRLRIRDADIVVASSTGWAHGFPTEARKLVYCNTPARFLYLTDQYLGARSGLRGRLLRTIKRPLIRWDQRAALSADRYLGNSTVVRDRIADVYGIDAGILFCPVSFTADGEEASVAGLADWADEPYFLVVSRLLPYKNVDKVISAFAGMPGERLAIVGRGPLEETLRSSAPDNVRILTGLSDPQMRWVYGHSAALIAPSFEDFGLTPLEAGSFGKATIALRGGGYLDTVVEGRTGLFFAEASPAQIRHAVQRFRAAAWDPSAALARSEEFSESVFIEKLRAEVASLWARD